MTVLAIRLREDRCPDTPSLVEMSMREWGRSLSSGTGRPGVVAIIPEAAAGSPRVPPLKRDWSFRSKSVSWSFDGEGRAPDSTPTPPRPTPENHGHGSRSPGQSVGLPIPRRMTAIASIRTGRHPAAATSRRVSHQRLRHETRHHAHRRARGYEPRLALPAGCHCRLLVPSGLPTAEWAFDCART